MNVIKNVHTGQSFSSNLMGCPIFLPVKLSTELQTLLNIESNFTQTQLNTNKDLIRTLKLFFTKLISGDENSKNGFADIKTQDLFLWDNTKICKDIYVKKVANSINKFDKAKGYLFERETVTIDDLIQVNKILCPKLSSNEIRKKPIRAGNPQKIDHAFYCCPPEKINSRLRNLLNIINSDCSLSTALIAMMQFVLIHPFGDGNGRISRLLFLKMMNNHDNPVNNYLLLIFIKTINKVNYYKAIKDYREGQVQTLSLFHCKAVEWSNKSAKELSDLLENYIKSTNNETLNNHHDYSKLIVKAAKKNTMKLNGFEYHAKKNQEYIFVNTALFSYLNQFEYYLKFQYREYLY